jgi:ribosomal protein S13
MELMKQFGKNHEDLRRHVAQNISLLKELEERAEWGVRLDQNMAEARGIIERLDAELEKRTEWALSLDKTVEERTEWAKSLEAEVENRTKWARDLERELNECRRRIAEIESKRRMRQRLKKVVKRVVRRDS